ncbi:MAG: exo-beta-N-acetylmuramidase NamZ domain-containing protein [Deltaproteobacteria bacterium]
MKPKYLYPALISIFFLYLSSLQAQNQKIIKTGIEVLRSDGFGLLKGKNVGLITNPTGVDSQLKSTIDILFEAKGVKLVALFGPEHGVRGDVYAGEKIESAKDPVTGLPVYSLYGNTHKPTPEMLEGIDVLVYDIQDIGCRSYTYISTMGKAMEAAAENNIEFIVLDRPNPLGGKKIEGPVAEEKFFSMVGAFPIPYVYGMTAGELAGFLNGEKLLKSKCKLTVVPMEGWKRSMTYNETGLKWVQTSPHVPYYETAFFYVASGILGELIPINIGIGYTLPFQLFGAEWIDAHKMAEAMNALSLKGVIFRPIYYKPYYSKQANNLLGGVQFFLTEPEKVNLMSIQFLFLQEHHKLYPEIDILKLSEGRINMFDKVCGTDQIRQKFFENYNYADIKNLLNNDVDKFRRMSKKYYLY